MKYIWVSHKENISNVVWSYLTASCGSLGDSAVSSDTVSLLIGTDRLVWDRPVGEHTGSIPELEWVLPSTGVNVLVSILVTHCNTGLRRNL